MIMRPMELGQMIRATRKARGWSAERLADRAGIDRKTVFRMERGITCSAASYLAAVEALGMRIELVSVGEMGQLMDVQRLTLLD